MLIKTPFHLSYATYWQKLILRILLWLAAEIWLNCLGLDNLADYSEFIFEHHRLFLHPSPTEIIPSESLPNLPNSGRSQLKKNTI